MTAETGGLLVKPEVGRRRGIAFGALGAWVGSQITEAGDIADALLHEVLWAAQAKVPLSQEHFTVDGTLLEAWASHKSFRSKDQPPAPPPAGAGRNSSVDFRGERRSNTTHASTTDSDARLVRKSNQAVAILGYQGSVLLDHRHGLVVATHVTHPGYTAEGDAALGLLTTLEPRTRRRTLGADRASIGRTSWPGCGPWG